MMSSVGMTSQVMTSLTSRRKISLIGASSKEGGMQPLSRSGRARRGVIVDAICEEAARRFFTSDLRDDGEFKEVFL